MMLSNEQAECDRLDIMHQLMQVSLGGKLHLAPFKETARILDIGTGTGIWAMDIG
jgi:methylase of polypeptide subunit release factors